MSDIFVGYLRERILMSAAWVLAVTWALRGLFEWVFFPSYEDAPAVLVYLLPLLGASLLQVALTARFVLRREARRRRNLNAWELIEGTDARFALYLRTFALDRRAAAQSASKAELEALVDKSTELPLVKVGAMASAADSLFRSRSLEDLSEVGTVYADPTDWFDTVERIAIRATLIIVVAEDSDGLLREIHWLVGTFLLGRVVFLFTEDVPKYVGIVLANAGLPALPSQRGFAAWYPTRTEPPRAAFLRQLSSLIEEVTAAEGNPIPASEPRSSAHRASV